MIYLSKNNQTNVLTDNVANAIPVTVDVYLDDVLIGNFENLSTNEREISFIMPKLDLEEREYIMRLYIGEALIKKELVIVKDLSEFKPISITNPKTIKMYEKE